MTVTTRAALAATFALLALAGCKGQPVPVIFEGMDQVRYTRSVLKARDDTVYSSNYIDAIGGFRPGTEAKITLYSAERIDLLLNKQPHHMFPSQGSFDTSQPQRFLEKYFVASPEEIGLDAKGEVLQEAAAAPPEAAAAAGVPAPADDGAGAAEAAPGEGVHEFRLDKMAEATRISVMQGRVAVGMTKHEVYMALGPPLQVGHDQSAINLPLEAIMGSDRWLYYGHWAQRSLSFGLGGKRVLNFSGGKLTHMEK